MTTTAFDPLAPLPGPPDPWTYVDMPSLRDGPPYHLTDMIAAEPAVARRILTTHLGGGGPAAALADAIRSTAAAGRPIVVTGCGTSEHAAFGVADILRESFSSVGLPGHLVTAAQAFELALDPTSAGLVIGLSHEGGSSATIRALTSERATGATIAVMTASARSRIAAAADPGLVIETTELDQSWCHTIGYLSPMLAASAVASHLSGRDLDIEAIVNLLADGAADVVGAERIADRLADAAHLIVIGSGADRTAGRELALKVEEASWLPSTFRDLETFLHGHLPAMDPSTGLVLILTERSGRPERLARARQALAAARVVGLRSAAIVAADVDSVLDPDLTPAGRLIVREAPGLAAPVASLFGSATPLQLLTERLARARGTNPDAIRRDDPIYLAAAEAAEG